MMSKLEKKVIVGILVRNSLSLDKLKKIRQSELQDSIPAAVKELLHDITLDLEENGRWLDILAEDEEKNDER